MKFKVIASGSKGNSTVILTDTTKIVIDMGISYLTLKKSLEEDSLSLDNFTGILITHCHKDHINGLASLIKHTKLKVYIPYLMAEIQKSNPKSSPVITKGSSVFCNDGSCKPLCQSQLTERNYLEAVREKNTSMEGIRESRDTKQGMLSGFNILKDTKLNVNFRKSFKYITFNTDDSEEEDDLTTLKNPIKVTLLSKTGSGGTKDDTDDDSDDDSEDNGGE